MGLVLNSPPVIPWSRCYHGAGLGRFFSRACPHQLRFFGFGLGHSDFRSSTFAPETRRIASSGRFQFSGVPNPALNSDPACIVFRSFSSFRFLDFAQRFGAGAAG
jgi:hypothetical protein